jgi:hypothetical protein
MFNDYLKHEKDSLEEESYNNRHHDSIDDQPKHDNNYEFLYDEDY